MDFLRVEAICKGGNVKGIHPLRNKDAGIVSARSIERANLEAV